MSLRFKSRFSIFQFSVRLRGYRPKIWRRIQIKDCLLLDLHAIILAAFGFEGEHTFRFSRYVPCYLSSDDRFQPLALETWLSQLVPLDGRSPISKLPKYVTEPPRRRNCRSTFGLDGVMSPAGSCFPQVQALVEGSSKRRLRRKRKAAMNRGTP